MLRGVTCNAAEIAGTAVFKMVVSSDSIKNANATNQGSKRFAASEGTWEESTTGRFEEFISDYYDHFSDPLDPRLQMSSRCGGCYGVNPGLYKLNISDSTGTECCCLCFGWEPTTLA